ncbi:MAG: hypothetical protein HRU15_13110 [Planctomycetes bacterium]|nr:hypothetical protein [Planctomycetota bacterium]
MFGPESIAKSILISLPAFIGLTPILIAVVIYTLNLFMRILPWHICIEVVNTDQSGKVLVTNRIVNTIRRERTESHLKPKSNKPDSEIFTAVADQQDSAEQRKESDEYRAVTDQHSKKNKTIDDPSSVTDHNSRENQIIADDSESDTYRAGTDRQKRTAGKAESSAEYKAITDIQGKSKNDE